jgi:hypothetical protein
MTRSVKASKLSSSTPPPYCSISSCEPPVAATTAAVVAAAVVALASSASGVVSTGVAVSIGLSSSLILFSQSRCLCVWVRVSVYVYLCHCQGALLCERKTVKLPRSRKMQTQRHTEKYTMYINNFVKVFYSMCRPCQKKQSVPGKKGEREKKKKCLLCTQIDRRTDRWTDKTY